jgi:hypothetical protein
MAPVDRCDEIMELIDRVLREEAVVSGADPGRATDVATFPIPNRARVRAGSARTSA